MDFTRIKKRIDTATLQSKCVAVFGVGAVAGLCRTLIRCGVGRMKLFDKDRVGAENICRQEYMADQIGMYKTQAAAEEIIRINADADIQTSVEDICTLTDEEALDSFSDADVLVAATDNLAAQGRVNQFALLLDKPIVSVGMYPEAGAGEAAWWRPGLASCLRCLLSERYKAQEGNRIERPSDGLDLLAVSMVDSITGMIILALLTAGADNFYGRLIGQLGDRQFLQVKIDPEWRLNGRDVVRDKLGIPDGNDAFFSFCTIARRDPDPGGQCPDCLRYRRKAVHSPA